jgi:LysM repeat protein
LKFFNEPPNLAQIISKPKTIPTTPITMPEYTTVEGDTLTSIAVKFHTHVADLEFLNAGLGLTANTPIPVGTVLKLPTPGQGSQ